MFWIWFYLQLNTVWNSLGSRGQPCAHGNPPVLTWTATPSALIVFLKIQPWLHHLVGTTLQWTLLSVLPFPEVSTFSSPRFTTVPLLSFASASSEMSLLSLCFHNSFLTYKYDSLARPSTNTYVQSPSHRRVYVMFLCFCILTYIKPAGFALTVKCTNWQFHIFKTITLVWRDGNSYSQRVCHNHLFWPLMLTTLICTQICL
jgi:hypothetical protein